MGQPLAFISYRRSDIALAAQALHVQLRERFGPGRVFMDVGALSVGDQWPDRLRRAVEQATVLIAVIGPDWLKAADKFGRRRLDLPNDWVRNEIVLAIRADKPVLPLIIGSGWEKPPDESLPEGLQRLFDRHMLNLRDERWDDDVDEVVKTLVKNYGFVASDRRVMLPQAQVTLPALSDTELDQALLELKGWEPVESLVPGDYPNARHELRKSFRFPSFKTAIDFMRESVDTIQEIKHHPRWENQWRTVTVFLSTWDVGQRITSLDIDLARRLDGVYDTLKAKRLAEQRPV